MKKPSPELSRQAGCHSTPGAGLHVRIQHTAKKSERRRLCGIVLCILGLLLLLIVIAVPLYFKYTSDKKTAIPLRVSVSVPLHQNLEILSQVPTITLNEIDLDRGYVDLPAATRLSIYNNDKSGCLLHFKGLSPPFAKILIRGLGGEVQIGPTDGFVYQAYSRDITIRTLDYRFFLMDDAPPGEYPWPLDISLDETFSQ